MQTPDSPTRGDIDDEIARLIAAGDEHIRQGRGSDADACFRQVLDREADHPDALHRRGILAFRRGEPREAVDLLSRAVAVRADDATLLGHLAGAHMAAGNLDEAIVHFNRALELAPEFPAAHLRLGDAYSAKGDMGRSEASYRQAIALAPEDPRGHVGLARTLLFGGNAEEGEAVLHRALELTRGAPDMINLVATVLVEAGGLDAALELFEASIHAAPDDPAGHAGMGIALHMLGRAPEAEEAYRKALGMDPGHVLALKHLGVLMQERGDLEAAADCFRRLIAADPTDDVARHMLAATTGETTTGAPAGYVTRLFDDYADRFDAHLEQIAYRVPELIRDAIREVIGRDEAALRVLDIGCGTGRCGVALRPLAGHLTGIDLSARMIAKCRARNVYDSLEAKSIEAALEGREESYDLIVAGDVFTYLGDLARVVEDCARALRPGGLMAFSVEDAEGVSYVLRPTGRYAHSMAYVDDLAKRAGLARAYHQAMVLRDDPVPIPGRIVILSKAA